MRLFSVLLSFVFIFTCICTVNAQKFDSSYSPRFKTKTSNENINSSYKTKKFELMRFRHLGSGEAAIIFGGEIIYGNSGMNNNNNNSFNRGNNNRGGNRGFNRGSSRNNRGNFNRGNSRNFGGNNNRKFR